MGNGYWNSMGAARTAAKMMSRGGKPHRAVKSAINHVDGSRETVYVVQMGTVRSRTGRKVISVSASHARRKQRNTKRGRA